MFTLKKLHPPFGSTESPVIEASYSEGEIHVTDGFCKVRLPETRDRLLKIGYEEVVPQEKVKKSLTARKSQEAQHSRPLGRKRR